MDTHSSLPGKIKKFYPEDGTADIEPLYTSVLAGKKVSMPTLPKVPISIPRSGGFAVTSKFAEGDFVRLTFADRSLDEYLKDGKGDRPAAARMNNLSDATASPMAYPGNKKLSNYENDRTVIRSEDGKSSVGLTDKGKLVLKGKDGESLVHILNDALELFRDHTNNMLPLDQKAQVTALLTRLAKLKE